MQSILDKSAISLSFLCVIHCLVVPVAIVLLPSLAVLPLGGEAFHFWMVIAVVPTSVYALTMGCKKHNNYQLAIYGVGGLIFLMVAAFLGELILNEFLEKAFTFIGASIIALVHYKNYRQCSLKSSCSCADSELLGSTESRSK